MATNKRMFSNDIVGSDAFLEMPPSTQALYFHLGMKADDDGFVSPRMVMRLVSSSDDELKVLIAKKFVLPFQDGVLVIKHWRINNNKIQGDRYKPTLHQEKLKTLFIKENGAYTLDESQDYSRSVNSPLTQNRIEENRIEENRYTLEYENFWAEYPEKKGKGKAYESWKKLNKNTQVLCLLAIKNQVLNNHFRNLKGENYIPHPTTWLNQRRWEDEVKEIKQHKITIYG
tara:strand:+ start:10836 stop:11522 length:687 start_codon:yes stop_codon:yes gene_type:complete